MYENCLLTNSESFRKLLKFNLHSSHYYKYVIANGKFCDYKIYHNISKNERYLTLNNFSTFSNLKTVMKV